MRKALLILAHGSRARGSAETVHKIADNLRKSGEYGDVEVAFLQFERPDISESASRLVEKGIREIVAVPAFLAAGNHVLKDIPEELKKVKAACPQVRIALAEPIGYDERICSIISERAKGNLVEI
ncbi:MAG: CbiX/SirB N-terminal domain-containing protein [Tepidanaerobacteraceae bacterium]|jgi:sirohydrochlorin cobaltochelatase|nr:CbiX/SirB N-terminal domain-containing protein [Tepidanaerobacteraceae bacterium]